MSNSNTQSPTPGQPIPNPPNFSVVWDDPRDAKDRPRWIVRMQGQFHAQFFGDRRNASQELPETVPQLIRPDTPVLVQRFLQVVVIDVLQPPRQRPDAGV